MPELAQRIKMNFALGPVVSFKYPTGIFTSFFLLPSSVIKVGSFSPKCTWRSHLWSWILIVFKSITKWKEEIYLKSVESRFFDHDVCVCPSAPLCAVLTKPECVSECLAGVRISSRGEHYCQFKVYAQVFLFRWADQRIHSAQMENIFQVTYDHWCFWLWC